MASAEGSDTKNEKYNIPLEILINILSRVPARSIGRFRCLRLTNPCNGLIGFYDHSNIQLCNLTTREVITLPNYAELPMDPSLRLQCNLGFHPVTKEYKLVILSTTQSVCTTEADSLVCQVFTLGSGLWREIGSFPYKLYTKSKVTVNGAIYWLGLLISNTIVSFDLKDERFIEIPFPDHERCRKTSLESLDYYHFLGEEEGNACLVASSFGCLDVWILKGDINHVWIHKYHVIANQCSGIPVYFCWPVCSGSTNIMLFIRKGKMLLSLHGKLCYYDLRSQSVDCLEAPHSEVIGDILVYVESLVSLGDIEGSCSTRN